MNIPGSKSAIYFLGTAVLTFGFTGLAAQAETLPGAESSVPQVSAVSSDSLLLNKAPNTKQSLAVTAPISAPASPAQPIALSAEPAYATEATALSETIAQSTGGQGSGTSDTQGSDLTSPGTTTTPDTTTSPTAPDSVTPAPGTTTTPDTTPPDTTTTPDAAPAPSTTPAEPASPGLVITPGTPTRSGPSYIGVGGNIGLGDGDTALGEGSFAVFSKIGLTRNISVRPAVLFSDNATILLPVTFDFIPLVTRATETATEAVGFRASPFIGPGIVISTGDDSTVDFLLTGGVDIPLTNRLSVTAQVNASFFDNVAVGLLLGVGFNF